MRDEILEELKKVDMNNNNVSDIQEVKSFWSKTVTWVKEHKTTVILITAIALCLLIVANMDIQKIKEVRSTQEVKLVQEPKIMKEVRDNYTGDVFKINVDTLKVTKVRETTSRKTGKDLFVVYREDKNQNIFLTIFEAQDSLKYNKEEFNKYIERESKNAEKLSK